MFSTFDMRTITQSNAHKTQQQQYAASLVNAQLFRLFVCVDTKYNDVYLVQCFLRFLFFILSQQCSQVVIEWERNRKSACIILLLRELFKNGKVE